MKKVNFIKSILMLLIVLYHSIIFLCGRWFDPVSIEQQPIPVYIINWLNSFHIYAFTLVSGYIFYYMKCEKRQYQKFLPFIANKVKRLIVPFFVVSILWCIPIYGFFYGWDFAVIMKSFLLGISPNQLWFLLMLFWVFLIFYPLSKFFKEKTWLGIIAALGFYGLGIVGAHFLPNVFQIWTACRYIVFFFLGFKMRQEWDGWISRIPFFVYIIADLAIFAVVCFIQTKEGAIWSVLNLGFSFVLNVVGSIMAWTTLQFIADKVKWQESKVMKFLSERSMIVYLFHQQ